MGKSIGRDPVNIVVTGQQGASAIRMMTQAAASSTGIGHRRSHIGHQRSPEMCRLVACSISRSAVQLRSATRATGPEVVMSEIGFRASPDCEVVDLSLTNGLGRHYAVSRPPFHEIAPWKPNS